VPDLSIEANSGLPVDIGGHGYWWHPKTPDKRVSGILSFNPRDGGTLTTIGGLEVSPEFEFDAIIFGEIKGREYTLNSAFRTSVSETFARTASTEESWIFTTVLVGGHLADGANTKFVSLELTTKLLSNWLNKPRPRIDLHNAVRIEASSDIPAQITSNLGNGTVIDLVWTSMHHVGQLQASASLTPVLNIKMNDSNLYAIHDNIVTPLIYLLSFCLGSVDAVDSLKFEYLDSVTSEVIRIQAFESRWYFPNAKVETRFPHEQLVQFSEIEGHFEDFLKLWFKIYDLAKFSLIEYFATVFDNQMFAEEKFLRVIRSLESWHGFYYRDEVSSDFDEMKRILENLKILIPPVDYKLISDKIGFMSGPSLRERLTSLIENSEPGIQQFLGRFPNFVDKCLKTRNRLTHHSSKTGHFQGEDLFWAEQYAAALLVTLILRELGFNDEGVQRDLKRSRLGQLIKYYV
jgi:hypothetical protein